MFETGPIADLQVSNEKIRKLRFARSMEVVPNR